MSAAPAAPVGQVESAVQVVQAEDSLLALAVPVEAVEGRPSVAAMACQQVAEA